MPKNPEDHFEIPPDTGEHAVAKDPGKPGGIRRLSIALRRAIALMVIGAALAAGLRFGPKRYAIPLEMRAGQSAPVEVIAADGGSTRADGLADGERSTIYFLTFDHGPFLFTVPLEKGGTAFERCGHVLGGTEGIFAWSPFRGYTPIVIGSTKGDKPEFTAESIEPEGTHVACKTRPIR